MPEPIESERITIEQDDQRAVQYAPDEPKSTIIKCLLVATTDSAGVKADAITDDVILVWTGKAIRNRLTPEEIEWAFAYVSDHSDFFPTWHRILAAVQDHRSYSARIGAPPEPKALLEPVSADQRKALTAKMDALTVGVSMNRGEDRKPRARTPVVITDAERAEGQRQIAEVKKL